VRFYRSIYELPLNEQPPADVLEDDVQLDKWFEAYRRELVRKAGGRAGDPRFDLLNRTARSAIPEVGPDAV
jgi:hypothetical protein